MPGFLGKIEFFVGAVLLAVITFLVFIAAVMRFFGHPLIWSVDLAQLLFIWLCFVGATRAMRERVHLGVDFLVRLFPFAARRLIETALAFLFIAFLLVLAYEGYKLTMLNWQRVFGDSGLSYAWVTISVPAGSILLTISILSNTVLSWRSGEETKRLVFTRPKSTDELANQQDAVEG
ncbi:TRAP-type C4-dicarboxylate transport system, small permease component [Cohaesibacter marisflavi]|uniref:TRAP transporter small permease protein n=1 Tax=Cohaesibacter marisflavi TaxID=655353 RepID=A0A1I5CHV7_9HYPH|nr:TRAP transporter small permease [Cohaesibacter marisflavi]SFN86506.1 TRAP-type C4-dicarboxylate transport system, small permease component [Cohaesibacter marisflavi]